jgi:hypothetical protein
LSESSYSDDDESSESSYSDDDDVAWPVSETDEPKYAALMRTILGSELRRRYGCAVRFSATDCVLVLSSK